MAYLKKSTPSFALTTFLLIAAASSLLANSQPTDPASSSVTVAGAVTCGLPAVDLRQPVNVTLSCDGGRTALVPPVVVSGTNAFAIDVVGPAVKLVDPTLCFVYVRVPVAGCPALGPGEVLRAPIVLVPRISIVIICYIRIFITYSFRVFRIA